MAKYNRNKKRRQAKKIFKQYEETVEHNTRLKNLSGIDVLKDVYKGNIEKMHLDKKTIDKHSRINRQVSARVMNNAYSELNECYLFGYKIHEFGKYRKGYNPELDNKIDDYSTSKGYKTIFSCAEIKRY